MSTEMEILFEVRSKLIMKETLKKMGIDYDEVGSVLAVQKKHGLKIDCKTGRITYDSDDKKAVESICQNYTVNFYCDQAIKEGNKVTTEKAKNEIILHITR